MNNEDKPLNVPELRDGVGLGSVTIADASKSEKPHLYRVEYAHPSTGLVECTVAQYLRAEARTRESVLKELSRVLAVEFGEGDELIRFEYVGRLAN